jgi:hypothetical protein
MAPRELGFFKEPSGIIASQSDGMNQATSKTAVIATIAADLRGVPGDQQSGWFRRQLGIDIGERGRKGALRLRKELSPFDEKKGRKSDDVATERQSDEWIWDAVGINLQKLDLERALVVFEPLATTESLVDHLRGTVGVTEIAETYGEGIERRVVARVIYWGAQRRLAIDNRLREAGVAFEWWAVRRELPSGPYEELPAAKTWAALAHQVARMEGHAITDQLPSSGAEREIGS